MERTEGERALAVELYLWQARVAGASLTTLAHFEVLLRKMIEVANAIDPACGEWLTTHTEIRALLEQRPVSE